MVLEIYYEDHYQCSGIYVQKEKTVKKGIAFFDFDGTITTRDSLLEFIRFTKGDYRFLFGFLFHLHYIAAFKMKLVTNQKFKEKMLEYFYRN